MSATVEICECGATLEPHPYSPSEPPRPPRGRLRQPLRFRRLMSAWRVAREVVERDPDLVSSPLLYCPVCHRTRVHFDRSA